MSFEPQIKEGSRHFKLSRCDVALLGLINTSQHVVTGLDRNLDDIQTACSILTFSWIPFIFSEAVHTVFGSVTEANGGMAGRRHHFKVWKAANIEKNNG